MKRSHILAIILAALSLQAVADQQEPAYWMKQYPNADQSKVQRCLAVAQDAYEKNIGGDMNGHFWAVLWKGNAWEACMEGK